ncbi:MAG: hypothetical protein A3J27_13675 [Candidatus Tectomicrobia bacterium RIFCSPLOWO2_12_FULL_69_37]|nr:MAG: hypothetical protein A3I72_16095 [Candidatus Tectomicrobia bacterium RIFCSPLOWO2_02_FULL_70_19]OGL67403.1 MAG: hypothetical protein A3J27_13675 [Candidatus Tectomicrobia bacterium RIFCSPLOWO2_12_FULL_69_37]
MRDKRVLLGLAAVLGVSLLGGCSAGVGLTLFGVGAGVATGTAVSYTMNGIAYRTFAAAMPEVERAALSTLAQMSFEIKEQKPVENGRQIVASGNDREIDVQLENVSPATTRIRVVVSEGGFFFKDRATATEIIIQTEKLLSIAAEKRAGP